jgi:hypothetical protein
MKLNKKILMSLLTVGMLCSLVFSNAVKANETEVSVLTIPTDWAFTDDSKPLNDALITRYGTAIDTNNDKYITKSEAAAYVGTIMLSNMSIAGTIDGIQYFTQVTDIRLNGNQLTGGIPTDIKNLTTLNTLYLSVNQLNGTIPSELGELNITKLYIQDNGFTGTIPAALADNTNLTHLNLARNNLEGPIPEEFGNLLSLSEFSVAENNLSGDIPESLYNLPSITYVNVSDNSGLSGNAAEGFKNHPTLETLRVQGTDMVQAKPEAPLLSDDKFIYDDLASGLLNVDGTLFDGITQEDINKAQDSANWWQEPTKNDWQTKIDQAQELLNQRDAENAVNDLFNPDVIIKDTVTQEDIENAQDLVDKVKDVDKKQELQDKLDDAQKQLDQRDFVVLEGFKTFTGTGTVNTTIDAPVEKFFKVYVDGKLLPSSNYVVTSGSTVITLNENYLKTLANGTYNVEVEFVSGAKVSVPLTIDVKTITDPIDPVDPVDPTDPTKPVEPTDPTTPTKPTNPSVDVPTVSKPSVDPSISSSTNGSNVNTGDTTDMMMLYGMLAVSILGIVVISKRRKAVK